MLKHTTIVLTIIASTVGIITCGLAHGEATIADKGYLLQNLFLAIAGFVILLSMTLVGQFSGKRVLRNYSLLLSLSALLIAIIPFLNARIRINHTARFLEGAYQRLNTTGPPFPTQETFSSQILGESENLISHGYWVSGDRACFEIYYHEGSDSYTMRHPKGKWSWRGDDYRGPDE
jgi:hypothetical protein